MAYDDNFGTMGDDDLISLARQAGYLPEEKAESPVTDSPASVVEPSTPVQAPAPPQAPQTPTASVSVSGRAFNPQAYKAISAQTGGGLNQDLRASEQAARTNDAPMLAANTNAEQNTVEAEKAKAKAEVSGIHQEGEDAHVMQRLQDEFAVEESKINAMATAKGNQAKADYLASLNDFRASRVDPAQLWHNMTGGERFGTMMAAFAHDFLGARGINTSAMATLNKAIDRNIDAQVQAIHTKGDVAEGFKSLWYMQRNQSASDTEARSRVRGFLLDGAKQAVIANMAPYKAALASAQGQAAIAKVNEEFAKNLVDIYKHIDSNSAALRGQAIDIWKEKVNASIEQRSVAVKEREETRLSAKDKPSLPEPILDPESGQYKWYFPDYIQKEERVKVRESLKAVDDVNSDLGQLRDIARNGKSTFDFKVGTRFEGTDDQRFDAIAKRLAHNLAKANGERATDQDVADFAQGFRHNTWANAADADKVIAQTQKDALTKAKNLVKQYGKELPAEMQGLYGQAPQTRPFDASAADAEGTVNPPPKSTDQIHLENAGEGAADVTRNRKLSPDEITDDVSKIHAEAFKARPELFGHKEARMGDSRFGDSASYAEDVPNAPVSYEHTVAVYAHLMDSTEPQVKAQAVEGLKRLAGPVIKEGMGTADAEAYMAAMVLLDHGINVSPTE